MLVVLSGGGTAGHINPALALAEVLKARGCKVLYAGTSQGVEAKLVKQAHLPFTSFEASGFNRSHPASLPKALLAIQNSTKQAKQWLTQVGADVVVAFGGYACIPVGRAAQHVRIPVVVHEQNSVMGMANKYLAKRAAAVCLTYEQAALPRQQRIDKVVVTGNPVRSAILSATRAQGRALLGIPENARVLLVTGGSLGARHLNQAITALKSQLLSYEDLHVVHITGPREFGQVSRQLALSEQEKKRWHLFDYQNCMGETMAAADVIVSRAGATSLAEISARALPALLVPFPFATQDHQSKNARAYVEAGCAYEIADKEVDEPSFSLLLRSLIEDAQVRDRMRLAARSQKTRDAANNLANVVIEKASSPSKR